jgi:signal transduction histidine kinase
VSEDRENVDPAKPAEGFLGRKAVLIVDDDQQVRGQLEEELRRAYFSPLSVGDGKSVLKLLETTPVDIVLIDVKLPDMDGIDLLEKIKAKNPTSEVIVITGYGTEEIAIRALRKGAIDYIEKPLNFDELTAALGRAQERLISSRALPYKNTVLVVDDEKEVVDRLKRFLEKEGYSVYGCLNPQEALVCIAHNRIDVLITDVQMNGMNGLELLEKAKKLYPDIEGIVVTGCNTGEIAIKALRAGAFDYISKPLDLNDLLFSLSKAIERIHLNRNRLYRDRELKITSEIITKMNEELERRIEERSRELNKTQTQLFQTSKLATLGEMAAGLAHEINQPLNGIALISTSIRKLKEREMLTDDHLKSSLVEIDGLIKRMKKIIEHIRTFARQDALKFERVDIAKTVDSAMSLMGEQLRLHEIETEIRIEQDLPPVLGEPYQLEQVWINLMSNARDAVDEKGEKSARGEILPQDYRKKITITAAYSAETKLVGVVFEDNGIGIGGEQKKKVFEPFFTTKEVGKSTGLGLSISYGIIENHKGRIEFDSSPGTGTSVRVFLPAGEE